MIRFILLAVISAGCGDNLAATTDAGIEAVERCGRAPTEPAPRWWFVFDGQADRAVLSLEDYELLRRYRDAVNVWAACVEGSR